MHLLDARIPPPLIALLFALLMWLAAPLLPGIDLTTSWRVAGALPVLLLGAATCLLGIRSFGSARTTVNPLRPGQASALVVGGIYQYSRNPMYLGFAIALLAWVVLLASPLLLFGVAGFVLYMNRFQIGPEERALASLFGDDYAAYCQQVRRWL